MWPCFVELTHQVVRWQQLPFPVSSQGGHQRFLRKSSSTSSLTTVDRCVYCQNNTYWIRCGCEVKDISLWEERCCQSLAKRHDQIVVLNVWLQIYTFHLTICRWCIYINWKWCHRHKLMIFWQSWNLFSNSFINLESTAACSLLYGALCVAHVPKRIQFFAITWVSTVQHCPPRAPVSVSTALVAVWL